MDYPSAVLEKAQRLEQLLLRVEAGETLEAVNAAFGFNLDERQLARWQAKYEAGERRWEALLDGRHGHPRQAHSALREWLYARKEQDDQLRASQLAAEIAEKFGIKLSAGHINYLLRKRGLTAPPGRPPKRSECAAEPSATADAPGVSIDNAGLFLLEAAKVEMGLVAVVEETVLAARDDYLADHPTPGLHHLSDDVAALWPKLDHLLYLPLLGLQRPRDLYYYQGQGLEALYGFTYTYLTLEHFLGQLTRLRVGAALAEALATAYTRAWYPGDTPLLLFTDWHVKPHWTKAYSHAGHVAMWGRVMPGTKQLILSGPQGRLLGGWDYPVDTHMTHLLVDLEDSLEDRWERPIACTIVDSEGGGLPLGERYAQAQRYYISVLPREHAHSLQEFVLEGRWQPVKGDAHHRAVFAHWADPRQAAADPRRFVLMRPLGQHEPSRIYTGRFAADWSAGEIPWWHRRRWANNELRIRDLIQGANLNVNYGYTYREVPHRTRQREWEAAQERVAVTERQLSDHAAAVHNLRRRLAELQDTYAARQRALQRQLVQQRLELQRRQRLGQATTRVQQQVAHLRRKMSALGQWFQRRQRCLMEPLHRHQMQARGLRQRLARRIAARDAIDTETLCRERDLEKDQIMLDWQILLVNLHDWAAQHYFAPEWRNLSLEKATQMIYRKAGWVTWYDDRIEVVLEPYRYQEQQRTMEATCARFNAANLRWRDGRLLRMSVAQPAKF